MKIKINKDFGSHKAGDEVTIKSHGGVPTENFWRRRLRDAAMDNCCEIVADEPAKEEVNDDVE